MEAHLPWFFYLVMVADPIIIITVTTISVLKFRKANKHIQVLVASLEDVAREAVAGAAEDVRDEIVRLLPQRPNLSEPGRRGIVSLGALLGLSANELEQIDSRLKK